MDPIIEAALLEEREKAVGKLVVKCEEAIEAMELAEAWTPAARLKAKLRWFQEVDRRTPKA